MTYQEADAYLRAGRDPNYRKLENNTWAERIDAETIGVVLHRTYVVKLYSNGAVKLNNGGWRTVTTKDRINAYAPGIRVWQKDFAWYAIGPDGVTRDFENGMLFDPSREAARA